MSTICSRAARASPREFEQLAARVGGAQAVYAHEPRRAAEARAQIPAEVMVLVKQYDGRKPLIDIVEDSPFKPFDTIKITYRLAELGAIVRRETRESTPLTERLAVRDWLLGGGDEREPRQRIDTPSGVTEAGRRAAEAYAAEAAERAAVKSPADDILDDTRRIPRRRQGRRRPRNNSRSEPAPRLAAAKPSGGCAGEGEKEKSARRSRRRRKRRPSSRRKPPRKQRTKSRCSTPSTRNSSRAKPTVARAEPDTFDDLEPAAQRVAADRAASARRRAATGSGSTRRSSGYFRTQTRLTEPCGPAKRNVSALVSPPTSGDAVEPRARKAQRPAARKDRRVRIELLIDRAPLLVAAHQRRLDLVPLVVDERDPPDRLGARQIIEIVVVRRGLDVELVGVGAVGEDLAARVRLVLGADAIELDVLGGERLAKLGRAQRRVDVERLIEVVAQVRVARPALELVDVVLRRRRRRRLRRAKPRSAPTRSQRRGTQPPARRASSEVALLEQRGQRHLFFHRFLAAFLTVDEREDALRRRARAAARARSP